MELIITAIIAIIAGFAAGYLIANTRLQKLTTESEILKSQLDSCHSQVQAAKTDMETRLKNAQADYDKRIDSLKKDAAAQRAEALSERERIYNATLADKEKAYQEALRELEKRYREDIDSQKEHFQTTIEKVSAQMKTATDEMLKQRQKEFAETSNSNLGQIVNPLRETIDKMQKEMHDNTVKQVDMSSELKTHIKNMIECSTAAKYSAEELARVFKHGSKIQGDWGETVLVEMLQSQGLTCGIHYDTQTTMRDASGNVIKSDNGAMMRPDVILHLDKKREVIIDSKVSLTAFMDYVNAEDENERQRLLKAHIDSLQKHVKELSEKDYSSYIVAPKVKMDYVIMFVPHTGALWTALNAKPDLWRKAMEKNVFIADEQTLFAAIRIINLTWTQIAQAQNHEKVYALATEMLDRVGQFIKKYQAIGKALETAQKAYNEGDKKLQPTGQSILQTCAKLTKLGAKQSDRNPLPQMIDIDDIPALDIPELSEQQE